MLHALDRTLAALVQQEVDYPGLASSFGLPDGRFPSRLAGPTVHFFLYHVQENLELRRGDWIVERDGSGGTVRRRPPVRVDCGYIVTAWPSTDDADGSEEHRLLGAVMKALLRHRRLPSDLLQGELAGQEPPVRAAALRQGYQDGLALFWRSLGTGPKAAFDYTLTISVDIDEPTDLGPIVTEHVINVDPARIRT
jgi:hypothetical protein